MPIFVNMTDKQLSGWGLAKNGLSYYCVKCDNHDQAEAIVKAAKDRTDMHRIKIASRARRGTKDDHTKIIGFDELGDCWKRYYNP